MKPPVIRPMEMADVAAMARLFDLYRQFYERAPDEGLALRYIAQRLTQQDSVVLVADEPSAGLVGFCQLYPSFCSVEAAPIYVLYDLFVHPQARRAGLARLLLLAAEQRAAEDGKVRMDLTTARNNTQAQALYESLGWVRDDVFLAYSRRVKAAGGGGPA